MHCPGERRAGRQHRPGHDAERDTAPEEQELLAENGLRLRPVARCMAWKDLDGSRSGLGRSGPCGSRWRNERSRSRCWRACRARRRSRTAGRASSAAGQPARRPWMPGSSRDNRSFRPVAAPGAGRAPVKRLVHSQTAAGGRHRSRRARRSRPSDSAECAYHRRMSKTARSRAIRSRPAALAAAAAPGDRRIDDVRSLLRLQRADAIDENAVRRQHLRRRRQQPRLQLRQLRESSAPSSAA